LNAVNSDRVFVTPQTTLDLFNRAVEGLTPATVNTAVAAIFQGQGPLALVTTPDPIEGGEAAVNAMLEASQAVPVTAPQAQAALEWPYASFGTPAQPAARREVAELGATVVTFANGTTLTVKPTTYRDEQILISVRTGLGELSLPTDRGDPRSLAGYVFTAGGLGKLTADELNRVLSGRIYGANLSVAGDAYQLTGATRPQDLYLEMQVLTAFLTDPGVRPAPFEQIRAQWPQVIAQQNATPGGAFGLQAGALLASGDARQALPSAETVAAWTNDQLKSDLIEGLSQGPLEVVMVGDVTVDAAIAAVGATLAALPPRGPAPTPTAGADVLRFPAGTAEPVRLTHTGPAEQALGYIAWPTTDAIGDETESRKIRVLAAVMELRVTEEIREKQALAYSPSVSSSSSDVYRGYGSVSVTAQTTPENQEPLFTAVDTIAASLRDAPITEDELTRARASIVESLRRSQAGNEFWLGALEGVAADPAEVEQITTLITDFEAVTPADIQAAARQYLVPDKAWRASVVSATAPAQ
jgi:zinc protease